MSETRLSATEALAERRILLCGGTGFLGKVFASLLLDRFPEMAHLYLLVRSAGDARRRFREEILPSPAFDPLRRRYGARLERHLEDKLTVVEGDVGEPLLGLAEDVAARLAAECDVVVNAAGHVVFNAPLDAALRANVSGAQHALAFARRLRRPTLVHVSTCYVAGDRDGERREDEPVAGFHPRWEDGDLPLSAEAEVAQCERALARVREEVEDPSLERQFRAAARQRSMDEGKDPSDARGRAAVAQERKAWVRRRLTELGAERAKRWGWPNVYVYTKSLGEQLVAASSGVVRTIVRPAIIESALSFPHAGWNEGFTTTAPLIQFAIRGHSHFPGRADVILDLVPVDAVASALAAVTAQVCVEEPPLVYQLSTSDHNPLRLDRAAGLMELYRRRRARRAGASAAEKLVGHLQIRTVDPDLFEQAVPAVRAAAKGAARVLERVEAAPLGISGWVRRTQAALAGWQDDLRIAEDQMRTFRPYTADKRYVFRTDNVRALFRRLAPSDRDRIEWDPAAIDWADYWVNVHCPGLERWVLAKLERSERAPARRPAHRTVVELFDGATRAHSSRVAMTLRRGGVEERYTYAELRECALRAAVFLGRRGVARGDKVALLAENSPEWGMAFFGVVRSGAACVPIAAAATPREAVSLLARSDAKVLLLGEAQAGRRRDLEQRVREQGRSVAIVSLGELLAPSGRDEEREGTSGLPPAPAPDDTASILFTSGTTGAPRGVVLSHRNLASQVGQLLAVYDLDHRDGMLSLLPLHHSFELSAGLLVPLSRGARITYLSELTGDAITSALRSGRVTCMVGVPAVWDLMRRRLLGRVRERSPRLGDLASRLIALNRRLRDETPLNLGPLLFAPVHLALGGRIRYLISGGAALSRESLETFRGLGFELLEGYGLTEAAPVLTVNRPGDRPAPGVVGAPLPGVELRIDGPDASGVGEILARGPAVMAGYYNDPEATGEALDGGWLRTGDLGRLDGAGRLQIAGRLKDVVVGPDGENVHPEELERLYAAPALIQELCVVGLPDPDGAERVACLAVPNVQAAPGRTATEWRERIEAHVRRTAAGLPAHKRIRVLHVQEGELPRTATRKVQRREVATLLTALEADRAPRATAEVVPSDVEWLERIVAPLVGCRPRDLRPGASLDQLGLDSLGYAELVAALEAAGYEPPPVERLASLRNLGELAAMLAPGGKAATGPAAPVRHADHEIAVPPLLAALGRRGYRMAERLLYGGVLQARVRGRMHVPREGPFLVAANHLSHLDAGLVRLALGASGDRLFVLAAADYFFDTALKRAFFSSFAGLLPVERGATTADSLRRAVETLEKGFNVLVFPEGTRSRSGALQEFHRGVGHLALRARVGVLPVRVETRRALPPGSLTLKSRRVDARIGPFLGHDALARRAAGRTRAEAEREVSRTVREAIERLGAEKDRRPPARLRRETEPVEVEP